ncbi:hypothetical protein GCM10027089_20230 [Nocardia thraciensis]
MPKGRFRGPPRAKEPTRVRDRFHVKRANAAARLTTIVIRVHSVTLRNKPRGTRTPLLASWLSGSTGRVRGRGFT